MIKESEKLCIKDAGQVIDFIKKHITKLGYFPTNAGFVLSDDGKTFHLFLITKNVNPITGSIWYAINYTISSDKFEYKYDYSIWDVSLYDTGKDEKNIIRSIEEIYQKLDEMKVKAPEPEKTIPPVATMLARAGSILVKTPPFAVDYMLEETEVK